MDRARGEGECEKGREVTFKGKNIETLLIWYFALALQIINGQIITVCPGNKCVAFEKNSFFKVLSELVQISSATTIFYYSIVQ